MGRLLTLILCTAVSPAAVSAERILDETAYCRSYVQFKCERLSPASLRTDGEKVLGKRSLYGLKRRAGAVKGAWTDNVYYSFQWLQYGGRRDRANRILDTPPPPAGWMRPEFDDSGWLYQRQPLMIGAASRRGWFRRASFSRFRFQVPHPAKVKALELKLVYHGGARVFVNGTEVARGHLPQGELGPDVRGADYPLAAYVRVNDDGTLVRRKDWRGRGESFAFVGALVGSFDDAPKARDRKRREIPGMRVVARRHIDRKTWEKSQKLRDRVLGPITIPARLLRRGTNVLAVEIRASDIHPVTLGGVGRRRNWTTPHAGDVSWSHGQTVALELRDRGGATPSMLARPTGIRAWAEDMHRHIISSEYLQEGQPQTTLRFVGANNGSFSGQVVVSTGRKLPGLKLTPTDLKTADGAVIPAAALKVFPMTPHRLDEWRTLGWGRGGMPHCRNVFCQPAAVALRRHGPPDAFKLPREKRLEELRKLSFFDHISSGPQPPIPANSCRPSWVILRVPADAKPGTYRGSIRVEAANMKPLSVPVEAEVYGWRVPEPRELQVKVALEQSPYGVALQHKVPLWSDEHFHLIEASLKQLARVGNDWVNIPVINFTEFGNLKDSMIRWVRRPDGALSFDYTALDKYLDLVVAHLGKPQVINFVVMHGAGGFEGGVEVREHKTGAVTTMKMGPKRPYYRDAWKAFATALRAHMQERGLERSMYWGYMWDSTADSELIAVLASVAPDTWWTKGAHRGRELFCVRAFSQLLPFRLATRSHRGWKNPLFHVCNPRGGGSLIAGPGIAAPFNFRLMVDRALVQGLSGVGRMGADYWGDIYIKGLKKEGFLRAGMPHHFILWPGRNGADPSVRFMALREGLQETEARIFLEQLLARKALPDNLAKQVDKVLYEHHRQTLFIPSMSARPLYAEMCRDWQDRSRRLFGVAAKAAQAAGIDLSTYAIAADIPARGRTQVPLVIRGWSAAPRKWKITADQPWVMPAKTSGTSVGHRSISITLDATKLPAGQTAKGALTVTDVTSGRSLTVPVTGRVGKVLDYVYATRNINRREFRFVPDDGRVSISAEPGGETSKPLYFFNRSAVAVSWKATPSVPWLVISPSGGKAEPGAMVAVKLAARPGRKEWGKHDEVVTISEVGGPAREDIRIAAYVLPAYRPPAAMPQGKAVRLDRALHKALLRSRKERRPQWCGHEVLYVRTYPKGHKERAAQVETSLTMPGPAETVYNIDGKGFKAFSAKVDLPVSSSGYKYWAGCTGAKFEEWTAARFEVYVDGRLRAHSGWIGRKSKLQTLVANGLAGARELKLVTRFRRQNAQAVTVAWWDARFYK